MTAPRVLILTAVIPEARALARAFCWRPLPSAVPFWQVGDISVACVGIGARRLPALGEWLGAQVPQLVVMAGVAGALSPVLQVGDVVVDAGSCGESLPTLNGVHVGRMHTAEGLVTTAAQKSQLFQKTGCLGVDMETEMARRFAVSRGAVFLAVRGISDAAGEPLDPKMFTLVDAEGRPRIARAMAMVAAQPSALRTMLRLKRATDRAMAGVVETLKLIIASRWPAEAAERQGKS